MGRKKEKTFAIRVQPALGKSFEEALAKQGEFGSNTAFFEDCVRALIHAVREGKDLEVPLAFLEREKPGK